MGGHSTEEGRGSTFSGFINFIKQMFGAGVLARDQLKADNASLAQQLREAKEWNDNLEREREDLYHLLDEAKSGNGAAMETS